MKGRSVPGRRVGEALNGVRLLIGLAAFDAPFAGTELKPVFLRDDLCLIRLLRKDMLVSL